VDARNFALSLAPFSRTRRRRAGCRAGGLRPERCARTLAASRHLGFLGSTRDSPVCAAFSWISPWRIVWIPLESFVRNERFQRVTSESSR
jgi:hypothetical protein